jgi:hypothetical protein
METWQPVVDVNGNLLELYEVSTRGRVRTYCKLAGQYSGQAAEKPRPKAVFPGKGGFRCVSLRDPGGEGKCFVYLVQHLVAIAFIGPRPTPRHCIIHLNHDLEDNRPRNLAWVTKSQASHHAMKHTPRRGIHARFTPTKVRAIRASKLTVKQLAAKHGVTVQSIYAIRKRHTWKDVA